jgi:hypothetical protein
VSIKKDGSIWLGINKRMPGAWQCRHLWNKKQILTLRL